MWGLLPEEISEPPVGVWADNIQSVLVFTYLMSQWRHGFAGRTGLDYGALREVWIRTRTPIDERDDIFDDLRVMENAVLEFDAERREQAQKKR